MKPFQQATYGLVTARMLQDQFPDLSLAQAVEQAHRLMSAEVWKNDEFEVAISRIKSMNSSMPDILHLSIKRLDKEAIHDWRKMQEIKNTLVGPEHEGIELYPAESRLVDSANQYHLWVFDDPEFRLPIGFNERLVTDNPGGNAKQRKGRKYLPEGVDV